MSFITEKIKKIAAARNILLLFTMFISALGIVRASIPALASASPKNATVTIASGGPD